MWAVFSLPVIALRKSIQRQKDCISKNALVSLAPMTFPLMKVLLPDLYKQHSGKQTAKTRRKKPSGTFAVLFLFGVTV